MSRESVHSRSDLPIAVCRSQARLGAACTKLVHTHSWRGQRAEMLGVFQGRGPRRRRSHRRLNSAQTVRGRTRRCLGTSGRRSRCFAAQWLRREPLAAALPRHRHLLRKAPMRDRSSSALTQTEQGAGQKQKQARAQRRQSMALTHRRASTTGAVLATELKNNAFKLGRWTAQAFWGSAPLAAPSARVAAGA